MTGAGVSVVGQAVGDSGVGSIVVNRNDGWKSSEVTGCRRN